MNNFKVAVFDQETGYAMSLTKAISLENAYRVQQKIQCEYPGIYVVSIVGYIC